MNEFNKFSDSINENNNAPQNDPQQDFNPYNQSPQQYQSNQNVNQDPYNQFPQQNPYNQPYQQTNYTYNQQGYPQQNFGGYTYIPYPKQPSTGMAIASLVLGIISIFMSLFMFSFPVLFLLPIIGLILGIVFKCKHLPVGKGLSTAGIITSAIGLIIPIIILILIFVFMPDILAYLKEVSPEQYQQLYDLYGKQLPFWFEEAISMFIGK